ncbi:hypothetical protein [Streptomyces tremellae]|uniref:Uncharacterized protein n=1 Tax=Streptomyces tremellae TaxID=1124239 RepID=A0ABP7E3N9_9ACTN
MPATASRRALLGPAGALAATAALGACAGQPGSGPAAAPRRGGTLGAAFPGFGARQTMAPQVGRLGLNLLADRPRLVDVVPGGRGAVANDMHGKGFAYYPEGVPQRERGGPLGGAPASRGPPAPVRFRSVRAGAPPGACAARGARRPPGRGPRDVARPRGP